MSFQKSSCGGAELKVGDGVAEKIGSKEEMAGRGIDAESYWVGTGSEEPMLVSAPLLMEYAVTVESSELAT